MSQSGLKHAATEPDHLDTKRERSRRGAAGRTAALRRAPSDSDCSGETASLSADSADRVRPTLVPPRPTKQRSRRRGSEWEVLEGLKDGQRFERRPEVFNGYLHKKRKWPLKGWHKRFFVVDGGILVYARSPADVARGRLHGSLDVGLAVVSAKARRRRLDIDADEFIYHLRAKTPDAFRTWLGVLKAHRLYRQHQLTFGARSAPKTHPPLDDLPPTDTSSLSSSSSRLTHNSQFKLPDSDDYLWTLNQRESNPSPPCHPLLSQNPVHNWNTEIYDNNELIPINFEPLEEENLVLTPDYNMYIHSMCSMNCLEKIYKRELAYLFNHQLIRTEKQLHTTELGRNSMSMRYDSYIQSSVNSPISKISEKQELKSNWCKHKPITPIFSKFNDRKTKDDSPFFNKKPDKTTTFFLFAHKNNSRSCSPTSQMKRSKKSTNLFKYRNCSEEPPLRQTSTIPMLLPKYKTTNKANIACDKNVLKIVDNEMQASIPDVPKQHKALQDMMTASEYDKITEQLVLTIFQANRSQNNNCNDIKHYVDQMVKELFEVKLTQKETHPVKMLFRSLLEYWIKNSTSEYMKTAVKNIKSVVTQSSNLTRDQNLSSVLIPSMAKETQIQENCGDKENCPGSNLKQMACMEEKHIQELEKILNNTIYTNHSNDSKENDIKITKNLLKNIKSYSYAMKSHCCNTTNVACKVLKNVGLHESVKSKEMDSDSSAEYPKILETFENFVRKGSMPPLFLKGLLEAYLKMLGNNSNTTESSDDTCTQEKLKTPTCGVVTELMQKNISVSVGTVGDNDTIKTKYSLSNIAQELRQIYLKDNILDNIPTTFMNQIKHDENKESQNKCVQLDDTVVEELFADELKLQYLVKHIISNNDDESVVIDLTNYDLERISMCSDRTIEGTVSITIQLRNRSPNFGESKVKNLNFLFSEKESMMSRRSKNSDLCKTNCTAKNCLYTKMEPQISFKNLRNSDPSIGKEKKDFNSNMFASSASSKAYKILYENENSCEFSLWNNPKNSLGSHEDRLSNNFSSVIKKPNSSVIKPKKKNKKRIASCLRPMQPSQKPHTVTASGKAASTIDENFIILLLENLTLLSQNLPGLYKEMSVFYLKLKKKHHKGGLGLLGQIYSDTSKIGNNRQHKCSPESGKPSVLNFNSGTNEENNQPSQKVDKCTSVEKELKDAGTLSDHCNCFDNVFFNKNRNTVTSSEQLSFDHDLEKVEMTEVGVSSPYWFKKVSKNCAMATALRRILNSAGSCSNFRFVTENNCERRVEICKDGLEHTKNKRDDRIAESGFKQNFIDLNLRPVLNKKPSKDSIRVRQPNSQSPNKKHRDNCAYFPITHRDNKQKSNKKNCYVYDIYPIFACTEFPLTISSSEEIKPQISDDLKTIYRCSSAPSYVSG